VNTVLRGAVLLLAALAVAACHGGSSGSTVTVPSVVGQTESAAEAAVTGLGLSISALTQQSSTTVASGLVIAENPAAGTSVLPGSSVALEISTGPSTFTVGGTLIGLAPNASVHVLNGSDNYPVAANGTFTLPTAVAAAHNYAVTVGTPTSAQACAVQNGSGTVTSGNVTSVVVYCTYSVTNASLDSTYVSAGLALDYLSMGTNVPYDYDSSDALNGQGAISSAYALNSAGSILSNQSSTRTYTVTTGDALPSYADSTGGLGGIEGINGDAIVSLEGSSSGEQPSLYAAVRPNASANTASFPSTVTAVLLGVAANGSSVIASEGTLTLGNGVAFGTLATNQAGTVGSNTLLAIPYAVANGVISFGNYTGAVGADGNLTVLADLTSGNQPGVGVLLTQGTGITAATLDGIYSVIGYGGNTTVTPRGEIITLYAYGNGTYSLASIANAGGTVTTSTQGSGTYNVTETGMLTLSPSSGNPVTGALSADGNTLVLADISAGDAPQIYVGVRQ
jgi:hypothetical protein